jgi:23S rRNA (uridine2552-2'-O)-methyltransferase
MTIHIRNNKINKAWLLDHLNDPYVKLAQKEGYRARAAYKLKELDETFRLVKPGHVVVDLGAVPGAWSQYLRRKLAIKGNDAQSAAQTHVNGTLIALDLLDFEPIDGVHFIQGDFREDAVLQMLEATLQSRKVNVVLSDMAPNLSGIESADAARMADLVELALDFAVRHLHHDGALVAKVFHGSGYSQLVQAFKGQFRVVKAHKPKASRDRSSETFLVGLGLKGSKA